MRKSCLHVALVALLGILWLAGISTPLHAETGSVAVVFTKGGLILGVGGGEGVLTFRGRHYPFTVSGMSVGATIGASTTKLVGQALNLRGPESIEGTYSAVGAGGALAGGAGSVAEHQWPDHQWRDLAAQRPQGRGRTFGGPGRRHHTLEVVAKRQATLLRGRGFAQYRWATHFIPRNPA